MLFAGAAAKTAKSNAPLTRLSQDNASDSERTSKRGDLNDGERHRSKSDLAGPGDFRMLVHVMILGLFSLHQSGVQKMQKDVSWYFYMDKQLCRTILLSGNVHVVYCPQRVVI
jgi:hypothetical protein